MEVNTMDKKIVYVLLGLVAVIVIFQYTQKQEPRLVINSEENSLMGNSQSFSPQTNEKFMTITMYDTNGNLISTSDTKKESIVNGVANVGSITVTISVIDTGGYVLTCDLSNLQPTEFSDAMTLSQKQINTGGRVGWTTNLIPVAQFEGQGQKNFSVTATCSYNPGSGAVNLPPKTGFILITITADPSGSGSFNLQIDTGGLSTEWCGDTICQSYESTATCPVDCLLSVQNVKYRAFDILYPTGSAVGYTATCGNSLVAYGYSTKYANYGNNCLNSVNTRVSGCGTATKLLDIPGGWLSGYTGTELYSCSAKPDELYVCNTVGGTNSEIIRYSTTDSDANKVDVSMSLIDPAKEVTC